MTDDTITIAAIMGLGEDPANATLHGLRDLLVDLVSLYPGKVSFFVFSHADPNLQEKLLALTGLIVLVGHSNGGQEAWYGDRNYQRAGRTLAGLLLLDAKPEWDSAQGVIDWASPWYQYPLPVATTNYHAFYGGFGRPFGGLVESTKLEGVKHEDFPGAPEAQGWLRGLVAQLADGRMAA